MAFPENPNTIILKADNHNYTNNITGRDIWNYYDNIKNKMIPFFKEKDLFVVPKTGKKIRINTNKEFEEYNTGRIGEFYINCPKAIDYFVLNLDPGKDLIWGDVKRRTRQLVDFLESTELLKKIEIYYNGKRGFNLWCYLKSTQNVDTVKIEWKDALQKQYGDSKIYVTDKKVPKPSQMNIDFSPVKFNGDHVAPFSMRLETGLTCVNIKLENLGKFKKKDSAIHNIFKDVLNKEFPWKIKKSNEVFNVVMAYLGQNNNW